MNGRHQGEGHTVVTKLCVRSACLKHGSFKGQSYEMLEIIMVLWNDHWARCQNFSESQNFLR